jgi:hypothetical protein
VFLPTFSRQVIDGKLLAAIVIVLVLWFVQYLVWVRPRDPVVIARRQARQEAALARIRAAAAPVPAAAASAPPSEDASKGGSEGGRSHA